ncbi:hypothetical protein M011DRAFT_475260 [Sporormia fimetaria CBS 119925]|uniref:Uncharacterized protein n=1 Tax=Sporormia fimetaria CBS 119925 TaxID=1340428 RepID=A0A6A6VJF2_9PLEO|nr:hypothetical protein M011DRAFT_475260 [Sporormia fimetaria CBS 119925]
MEELAEQVQVRLSNLSRSNSIASQHGRVQKGRAAALPRQSTISIAESQGVDLDTALRILQEVRKSASPQDLAALHQALQPSGALGALKPAPDACSTLAHRSTSSLTRRRSLIVTPGLATRPSPVDNARRSWNLRKAASHSSRGVNWKADVKDASPLTRFAALDMPEEDSESSTSRARTPGDMDYSHLGSFKLGSLVVTNGIPSPAASMRNVTRRNSNSVLSKEGDYFALSTETVNLSVEPSGRRRAHSRSQSSVLPQTPPLVCDNGVVHRNRHARPVKRCDSAVKTGSRSERDPQNDSTKLHLKVMNSSVESLARDYMATFEGSPFEPVVRAQPVLQDEGFSDSLSNDAHLYRAEAARILDETIIGQPIPDPEQLQVPQTQTSAASQSNQEGSNVKRARRPTPTTKDSGYSSGGSFRIAHHDSPAWQFTVQRASHREANRQVSVGSDEESLYNFEEMLALPISKKPLPPLPTENSEQKPVDAQDVGVLPRCWDLEVDTQLARLHCGSSTPSSPCPAEAPRRLSSAMSRSSVETTSSNQKRLQKRRPSMPDTPVVQSCQPVEGSIPGVPEQVKSTFVRRLSQTPEMECLTKTFLSKEHTDSEEATTDPPIRLSQASPLLGHHRHHRRSNSERPPSLSRRSIRQSPSLLHDGEVGGEAILTTNGDNTGLKLVDLGTVGTALGPSPYDAAMVSGSRTTSASPTHPHQLGALPQARTMSGMDAKTAADFARAKSKARAELRQEVSQRPGLSRRPSSYHDAQTGWEALHGGGRAAHHLSHRRSEVFLPESRPIARPGHTIRPAEETSTSSVLRSPSTLTSSGGRASAVSRSVGSLNRHAQGQHAGEREPSIHSRLWSQRCRSVGEGMNEQARQQETMLCDRYGGGLHYGYEGRDSGIGGSAGTRQLHSAASRKSIRYSHQYGLDLSDVPVFLQRIPQSH